MGLSGLPSQTITVLVPTFRRTANLHCCLAALQTQIRPADEVLVTVRDTDEETQGFLADFDPGGLPLRMVLVYEPGVIAAMNAGLDAATGDILALTDDDAGPRPDWLARIEAYFDADSRLGGVGGRDYIHYGNGTSESRKRSQVGRVQWHGRVVGNHHMGYGLAREVDLLKGVNGAYRTDALRRIGFDRDLRGSGAQVHWELSLGLALKRDGWKLVYDPDVAVDHYSSVRFDADTNHRGVFHAGSYVDMVHNETLILLRNFSAPRRLIFLIWAALIGTKMHPGVLLFPALAAWKTPYAYQRMTATWRGRMLAVSRYSATLRLQTARYDKACGR